jgi:hypothetical protein
MALFKTKWTVWPNEEELEAPKPFGLSRPTPRTGAFQPVLAKHSKHFSLQNALSIGVDQMQRNFSGMQQQVEAWRQSQLSDVSTKMIIYRAFIEGCLEVPKHLAKPVHDL